MQATQGPVTRLKCIQQVSIGRHAMTTDQRSYQLLTVSFMSVGGAIGREADVPHL